MQAYIILHNMIVEDEKGPIREILDLNDNLSSTKPHPTFAEVLHRNFNIKARPTHIGNSKRI